jgi:Fe-S-cluster containining protein
MCGMGCYKCGECCKTLYFSDRIKVSLKTKTLMLNKVCKFLDKNNKCRIYKERPKVCREWVCGASRK